MLQVARLAPRQLGEAGDLVVSFLRSQQNADGGFADRAGSSDLYYTVFGLEGLVAFRADLPVSQVEKYLRSFEGGEGLDFVHLCCLARCWASLPADLLDAGVKPKLLERIEAYRSADGGYANASGAPHGTLYGCFLALGAYQDLHADPPNLAGLGVCIASLKMPDGGYANDALVQAGVTPATAAAVTLLRQLGTDPDAAAGNWLLSRCRPEGGFFALPEAPMPDLLSTATALHALAGMQVPLDRIKEPCLDFIDSLWTNRGAFYGHWADDAVDCEYTYYALLALGHLSL
jgi:prenyltransferase beta subunit